MVVRVQHQHARRVTEEAAHHLTEQGPSHMHIHSAQRIIQQKHLVGGRSRDVCRQTDNT